MDDSDDGPDDCELAWKRHDRAAGSDYYGFSDPILQCDASLDLHGDDDSPACGQMQPVHSQSTANHFDFHDSESSTALIFSGDYGDAEISFADEDFDNEDDDDFEQDHSAVQLSLFGSMDDYLLSTQEDASDLMRLPYEELPVGSKGWPDNEGSDPFDESGPCNASLLRVNHVPDVIDDVEFAEAPLDLDLIVSQAAAAESAAIPLYQAHRGILVGDPASANLTTRCELDLLIFEPDVYCQILRYAKELLDTNQTVTKREIFYRDVRLFKTQATVDAVGNFANWQDLACAFGVPRFCLRIVASAKGLVYGNLIIRLKDGSCVDCSQGSDGTLIPPTEQIAGLQTDARFVLVIEKDATFRTLLDHGFADTHGPCVIVTGKGYPDVATRQLVRRLSEMKLSQSSSHDSTDSDAFASQPAAFEWDDGEVTPLWDPDENPSVSGDSPGLSPLFEPSSEPVSYFEPLCSRRMDEEDAEFGLSGGSSIIFPSADDGSQVQELAPTASQSASSSQSNENSGLRIPALALVDCDPHGIDIFLCYKLGSESLAFDRGTLACPSLRWLGILPTDWTTAGAEAENLLDSPALLPLTPHDRRKITSILRRPALRTLPGVKRQLSRMMRYNRKSEIQALEAGLLAHNYLPRRIAEETIGSSRH
ncbi:endodeoxyribonuclease [Geranomyces variabilis]|nr:endodeoxyribonuclease [Geranomyces variabilis]